MILNLENNRAKLNINLLFQDEVSSTDFTYLGRRLGDMESQDELACLDVKLIDGNSVVPMYQTLYKENCQSVFNKVFSFKNVVEFKSLNGAKYNISYNFLFDRLFLFSFLSFSLLVIFLINLIFYVLKVKQTKDLLLLNTKIETLDSLSKIASHFIHDVKSPLSLFNVLSKHHAVDSGIQESIKMAYDRVLELINKLNEDMNTDRLVNNNLNLEQTRIAVLIKQVVSEKMLNHQLKITLHLLDDVTVKVNVVEFKRVISNLLENAIEAAGESDDKTVNVTLASDKCIEISDNGKGIPPELLSSLGKRGFTFGKEKGSGLGLYHAFQNCKHWGAKLSFSSAIGKGTIARISF